jgi:hypothetical protein
MAGRRAPGEAREGSPEGPIPGHADPPIPGRDKPPAAAPRSSRLWQAPSRGRSASNRFRACSCGFGRARKPNRSRPPCRHARRQAAGRRLEPVVGGAGDGRRRALVPAPVSVPEGRLLMAVACGPSTAPRAERQPAGMCAVGGEEPAGAEAAQTVARAPSTPPGPWPRRRPLLRQPQRSGQPPHRRRGVRRCGLLPRDADRQRHPQQQRLRSASGACP